MRCFPHKPDPLAVSDPSIFSGHIAVPQCELFNVPELKCFRFENDLKCMSSAGYTAGMDTSTLSFSLKHESVCACVYVVYAELDVSVF